MANGSLAVDATHDPLFWAIAAAAGLAVAILTRRRRLVSAAASAIAAATAMVATLLPLVPPFDSAFPRVDSHIVRESLTSLYTHLGLAVTVALVILWVCAMFSHVWRWRAWGPVALAARAALLTGAVLCLAGALPSPQLGPLWMATVGMLMGLADADSRADVEQPLREGADQRAV
jgi:Mg2+/citrate symporter